MSILNDNSIMPIGKHKGEEMILVPDDHLKEFWSENYHKFRYNQLTDSDAISIMNYIEDSFDERELRL